MTQATVFLSWQSDIRAAACRTFIEDSLRAAVAQIVGEQLFEVEPVVDRDTEGLSGSPNIRDAIFTKISSAGVFVADVTPIGTAGPKGRPVPNPSVMIELGYAIDKLGWSRIVLVLNTAYGKVEELPFDIRGHRCVQYHSPEDADERAPERKTLAGKFREALLAALQTNEPRPGVYPAQLKLSYRKERITGERHDYELQVELTNKGTAAIKNYFVTVEIPRAILKPHVMHANERRGEGTSTHALFRFTQEDSASNKTLYPHSTELRTIPYHMTDELFHRGKLEDQVIVAKAYMNDQLVGEARLAYDDWQYF